jgi:hypothetical protein
MSGRVIGEASIETSAGQGAEGDILTLTRASPSRLQRIMALRVVPALLILVFACAKPFATVDLRPLEAFVPFYVTALFLNDLITAALLFAQFAILRTRAMLIIANGYLFAALMLIPYTLSFPDVFQAGSLVGNFQSTPWLYILRHSGAALFMCAFAVSDSGVQTPRARQGTRSMALLSALATALVVLVAALVCIRGHALLPAVFGGHSLFLSDWIFYAGVPFVSSYATALILLWSRRDTILGLWLFVVALINLFGAFLAYYPTSNRFSVGWYTVIGINL